MATKGTWMEPLATNSNVSRWIQRFEAMMEWEALDDTKKKHALLASIGETAFNLLADSMLPDKPADKSYKELKQLIIEQVQPPKLPIAARYEFYQLRQGQDDVATFLRKLKHASEECAFGCQLEDHLRDQFVIGLSSKEALKRMLTEKLTALNLEKAVEIAMAYEAVQMSQCRMKTIGINDEIHAINRHHKQRTPWKWNRNNSQSSQNCRCCGKLNHQKSECRFKEYKCNNCGKVGHLKVICRSQTKASSISSKAKVNQVNEDVIFAINEGQFHKIAMINGRKVKMVFDTGADVSLINERVFNALGGMDEIPLQSRPVQVKSYGGNEIQMIGEGMVNVQGPNQELQLPVIVIKGTSPCIFGGNWIRAIYPEFSVNALQQLQASLQLKENAKPIFTKPRQLPYGLKDAVKDELMRMVNDGTLIKVEQSEWATPIVPIKKPDGRIRICGDFKVTLNRYLADMVTTTPSIEDVINSMQGSGWFSELDLRNAYHQLPLDEESSMLTTLSTPFGLFRHTALPFGVKQAPAIFQNAMDKIMMNFSGVQVYQDNIYVHANSRSEHDKILEEVKTQLQRYKFKLNEEKCHFGQQEMTILGTVVNGSTAKPDPARTEAIQKVQRPRNVKDVRSFIGMVEFYGRYVPQLSTLKEPLTKLTRNDQTFVWGPSQQKAFNSLKEAVCQDVTLQLFDPNKEIYLKCDASPVGIGAVLEQDNRPVLFISKTLSSAERNYAQIEREALGLVWAVKRLHKYLFGRKFFLITDNEPLKFIFNPTKAIPTVAAARIQRWALFLMSYDFVIKRISSSENVVADWLSRQSIQDQSQTFDIHNVQEEYVNIPVDKSRVLRYSKQDPVIRKLYACVRNGWKSCNNTSIRKYAPYRQEFTIDQSLLYRGQRLLIPKAIQSEVLDSLHEGHPGIAAMKAMARQCVWWLGIDKAIETKNRHCKNCCMAKGNNRSNWIGWPAESKPWQRVHIDFAGPLRNGQYALIMVDAYTKWPEIHLMSKITSSETIKRLRRTFSQEGVPPVLVSDNGPSLVSSEMEKWLSAIGCHHLRSPPFNPRSNGIAERFVRTFKEHLRAEGPNRPIQAAVDKILLTYRNTPHSSTGESPAKLMKGRVLRTTLTSLSSVGDKLWVRNYSQIEDAGPWKPGTVVGLEGQRIIKVDVDGEVQRRHVDQTKKRTEEEISSEVSTSPDEPIPESPLSSESASDPHQAPRRSQRVVKKPERLTY